MVKVLLIGLDGATWDLILPWVKQNKLPTFKKLLKSGTWGILKSTIPPFTVPAWNSLTSGKSPGKLKISGLIQKVPGEYDFKPYFFILQEKRHHIWDILSKVGKKVVIANVPSTNKTWEVNGVMIAGSFMSVKPDERFYPKALKEELEDVIGFSAIPQIGEVKTQDIYLKYLTQMNDRETKMFQYLLTKKPWDFGFIVFETTDRVQHKSWKDQQYILDIHQQIDKAIAKILKIVDDETIIFFISDHGFGQSYTSFNINYWLQKEGYLNFIKRRQKAQDNLIHITSTLIYEFGLQKYLTAIVSKLPFELQKSMVDRVVPQPLDESKVDWSKTSVFCKPVCGEIYLNVKGREPEGIINPGKEYERIRNELITKLNNLTDPSTGRKLVPIIYKAEEVFGDHSFDGAPDLVMVPNDDIPRVNARVGLKQVFSKSWLPGGHRVEGIFLFTGPGIKKGLKFNTNIYNITPTILHIFNLPIQKGMDGKVMMNIFEEDSEYIARKPLHESKKEEELIKEKIKSMIDLKKIKI